MEIDYTEKYLKYKKKYLIMRNMIGGTKLERILHKKSQQIAYEEYRMNPGHKIGILIAGNAGRPGGGLGKPDGTGLSASIFTEHSTQEENIVASWLRAEFANKQNPEIIFRKNLGDLRPGNRPWGMINPYNEDHLTIQMRDFTQPFYDIKKNIPRLAESIKNYDFSHVLNNKPIQIHFDKRTNISTNINADLIFVYGPNVAYDGKTPMSTGTRTKVKYYDEKRDYPVFRDCVRTALKAGLIAMIQNGVKIAILAPISGGIYSGKHTLTHSRINSEYITIINDILDEVYTISRCGKVIKIGDNFVKVILPVL